MNQIVKNLFQLECDKANMTREQAFHMAQIVKATNWSGDTRTDAATMSQIFKNQTITKR